VQWLYLREVGKKAKKHGKGTEFSTSSTAVERSVGTWVEGVKDGHFKEYLPGGDKGFEGEYRNGERNGFGIEYLFDKAAFEGFWKNGQKHGHMKMFAGDELRFEGEYEFNESKRGVLYIDGMVFYEGELKDLLPDGYGIEFDEGRKVYEGEWKKGKYNGAGIRHWPLRRVGIWEDGGMVSVYERTSKGLPKKEYFRRTKNGSRFKLMDPHNLLWIGSQIEGNQVTSGSFQGPNQMKYGLVFVRKSGKRIFEKWDRGKCVFSETYLADWTTQEVLKWIQSHSKTLFGLVEDKNMMQLEKLVTEKQWDGFFLMELHSADKLSNAGVTNKSSQKAILELIRTHASKMTKIENMIQEFPEMAEPFQWHVERVLWIGVMKNSPVSCPFARLPRDVLRYMLLFLRA